jgi:hypothetical protein
MMNIKVLGTGCTNCKTTLKLIEEAVKAKGIEVQLEKIEDIAAMPDRRKIDGWLE